MADKFPADFGIGAARDAGYSDREIADYVAQQMGVEIGTARKAGYDDSEILDFLAPERAPEPVKKPEKAGISDDINRGWQRAVETVQMLRADWSAQDLASIEAAKAKADRGEYLTPWEKKQVANYDQASADTKAELAQQLGSAAERREKAEKLPMSPGYKAFKEAEGIGGKLSALWNSPADVVTSIIAEGAVASAPSLGAAVVGGVGPGMVAAGGTAFMQSYAGKILELLGKRGVDIKNSDAVMAALSDPDVARELRADATLAAIPQAAAGAASMAVAPVTLAPARLATSPVKQQAVNIPAQAAAQGGLAAAGEAGSQAAVGEELDSGKITEAFIGGASQGPVDVAAFAARRSIGLGRATPEEVAAPVLEAGTVDEAIAAARDTVGRGELETTAVLADEFGNRGEQDQAAINRLFGGLNDGEIQRAADGAWFYRKDDGQEWQLQPWDGVQREDTIPSALADAQRTHYEQQGVRVVYFENDAAIPFDGAVDPAQPNTIFLSNKPDRNAAQVGGHEIAHVFESTTLPDGTNLGDLLQQQVAAGITAEGRAYAEHMFGQTAPKREAFAEGPEGDSLHADAVTAHLFRELGADIGGEAPKFQTFLPRVVDAVEARYGADAAKDVLQKLMDGIRQAMTTLRQFFFRADEMAEYGQPPTESQAWVSNLEQIHGTLAQMYAQRFGEAAGLTDAPPARPEPQRLLAAPAAITPPPVTAENVFQPAPYGAAPGAAPIPPTAQERAAAAAGRPPDQLRLPAPAIVTPPPRPAITPENVFRPETYGAPHEATQLQREQRVIRLMAERRHSQEQAAETGRQIAEARETTNTEPTDGQKEAGNYLKGRVTFHGLPFVMENPEGSVRRGVDADGKPWEAKLPADYGYLSRTEGADGDQVDAYIGPDRASQRVWVVDQIDPKTGKFDEHKVMLGFKDLATARDAYERAFSDGTGSQRIGAVTEMPIDKFKGWLQDGNTTSPVGKIEAPPATTTPEPATQPAVAEAPTSFNDRLKAEKETVWADRSIMGRVQRGVARNEEFAVDVARERLMREDAAPLIRRALDEDDIPDYAIPEIARLYRQEDGEAVEAAFDRAVDRWVTKREAEGALIEQDLYEFDWLKSESSTDPVLAETFARMEEAYSGREREKPGDEDIPLGRDETGQAPARPGEAAAREEQLGGGQSRGGPRGRSDLAAEEGSALGPTQSPRTDKPSLSPRPPVARVAADELAPVDADIKVLRSAAINFYRSRLQGRSVSNPDLGEITFTGRGLREMRFASANPDKLRLVPALPNLLREGTVDGTTRDVKGHQDVVAYHRLSGPVEIGGKPAFASVVIEERTNGKLYYNHFVGNDEASLRTASAPGNKTGTSRPGEAPEVAGEGDDLNIGLSEPKDKGPAFSPRIRLVGDNPTRIYTPAQVKARENVRGTERRSIGEVLSEWRTDLGRKLVLEIFDPYVGLKDRDPKGYLAARMANSVTGAVDMFNTWGTLKFDGPVYATDKQTGGPVALIRDLGKEAHDFMDWVAANRAERLKAEDRENLFTSEDIAAMKGLNKGTLDFDYSLANGKTTRSREAAYLDALKRLDTANKNAQDLAVAGGLLKREDVDALWDNPFYVPFYRQAEDGNTRGFVGGGTGGFTGKTAFKKLKGGTEKLTANLWQNAFGNWAHLIDASIRNKAANQVLETALEDGVVEKVTTKQYDHEMTKAQKEDVVWTMVDGEKTYWRVDDPFTLKAIGALDYVQSSTPLMGIGRAAKRLLQTGVAASPIFQIRNLIRDTENAIAVSPIAKNVFRNLADGARQQDVANGLKNVGRAIAGRELSQGTISKETADAVAGGATMRYAAGVDQSFRNADTYLDSDTKIGKFWDYFRRLGQASTEGMGFGENMNRLALYRQLGEQGAPTELRAYEARDLSDFTLTGASPIIRHLVEVVPYMNAWMQGLYKVGRAAADADKNVTLAVGGKVATQVTKRLAAVTMGMVALNLALDAIYADDEDYQNRNEYDRNSNFWFKVGGTEFRIPMGFEVAALSRMAAIWIETLYDKDMPASRAWKNTLSILGTQMAFNPIPQAVKPLVDLYGNETRMGTPIESVGMQRLRPEFRSAPGTTLVAQGLSDAANKAVRAVAGPNARAFSPVQFDYLVQAYAGWLGTSSLQIADTVVRAMSNEPERPARDLVGKYTGGLISNEPTSQRGSGRYVNMLYQQGDAINEAYATYRDLVKRGRTEEAREYYEDNRDLISKNRIYQRVIRTESQLNEQIRAITNHSTMTGEQKRVRIMVLQAAKNRAARELFAPEASR